MKALLIASLLSAAVLSASATSTTLTGYYSTVRTNDNTIFAGATVSQQTSGLVADGSGTMGLSDPINALPMWSDTTYRANGVVGDLLVSAAVLRLVDAGVLPALTAAIPSSLLPRGVTDFYNPTFTAVTITLQMLLRHTSSISDTKFDSFRRTAPGQTVGTLTAFCQDYFTTSTSTTTTTGTTTTYNTATDIWISTTPGAATSYNYARANTALLSCIVDAAILSRTTLVAGTTKDVASYIQEQFIGRLGMSNTFRLNVDGSYPTSSIPAGAPLYAYTHVADLTSSGAAQTTNFYIHPAYFSDYMMFTSSQDLARLVRALFIDSSSSVRSLGNTMKGDLLAVTTPRTGMVSTGYGVMSLSAGYACGVARTRGYSCSLTDTTNMWGAYSVGYNNMVAVICTEASTTATVCTTSVISYYQSAPSAKSIDVVLGFGALATVADATATSQTTTATAETSKLQGLWIALGVIMVILFTLVAAYFTEYVVQPAPLTAGVAAAPPPIPASYGYGDSGMGMSDVDGEGPSPDRQSNNYYYQ